MNQTITPFKMVFSRSIVAPAISMTGHLFANKTDGALLGWLVNTWTERGITYPASSTEDALVPDERPQAAPSDIGARPNCSQPGGEDRLSSGTVKPSSDPP
jgi:hypothetical protein